MTALSPGALTMMNKRKLTFLLIFLVLTLCATLWIGKMESAPSRLSRPNVLLIVVDDMRRCSVVTGIRWPGRRP